MTYSEKIEYMLENKIYEKIEFNQAVEEVKNWLFEELNENKISEEDYHFLVGMVEPIGFRIRKKLHVYLGEE